MSDIINRFINENYYLSNFYEAPINYNGQIYRNNEAAFQSMKCKNKEDRAKFCNLNPSEAKHLGRNIELRKDWEQVKVQIMRDIVSSKFNQNLDLKQKLISTKDAYLEEGNTWGDKIWGCYYPIDSIHNGPERSEYTVDGVGRNLLGIILMDVRKELITMQTNEEKNALWNTLSNEAKNVLEWVIDPRTGKYNELIISVGQEFKMPGMEQGILITKELLDEIIGFVEKDTNLACSVKKYKVFIKENETPDQEEINTNEIEKE